MNENSQQPQEYDAVLSTQNTPSDALVLGGLAGVKKRLSDKDRKIRIAALSDAVKYGNKGIKLVLKALKDPSPDIYWQAYSLLKLLPEAKIQEIIRKRNPYLFFQCLDLFEGHSETLEGPPRNAVQASAFPAMTQKRLSSRNFHMLPLIVTVTFWSPAFKRFHQLQHCHGASFWPRPAGAACV